MIRKYQVGYIPMTADLFNIGHLRAIEKAKRRCCILIIGLLTDWVIWDYKKNKPIYSFEERKEILEALSSVDRVMAQQSLSPYTNLMKSKAQVMFSGDGFEPIEEKAAEKAMVILDSFPYYKRQSTTKIKEKIIKQYELSIK